MLIYLIDDRGQDSEYQAFIHAYRAQLPAYSMKVFTHWNEMYQAISEQKPDLILADMRFDLIPSEQLYGDIQSLAQSDHFGGNVERAEIQVRGIQGLLICRALRDHHIDTPIILFASLTEAVTRNALNTLAPICIIKGLILDEIIQALHTLVPDFIRG